MIPSVSSWPVFGGGSSNRKNRIADQAQDLTFLKSLGALCRDATEVTYFESSRRSAHRQLIKVVRCPRMRCSGVEVGSYSSRRRATGTQLSRAAQRRADLPVKIRSFHGDADGTYGAPRITADLREPGVVVTEKTVAAIIAAHGLAGISPPSFRVSTVADLLA